MNVWIPIHQQTLPITKTHTHRVWLHWPLTKAMNAIRQRTNERYTETSANTRMLAAEVTTKDICSKKKNHKTSAAWIFVYVNLLLKFTLTSGEYEIQKKLTTSMALATKTLAPKMLISELQERKNQTVIKWLLAEQNTHTKVLPILITFSFEIPENLQKAINDSRCERHKHNTK